MIDIDLVELKDELEEWQEFYKDPADKKNHAFFTSLIIVVEQLELVRRDAQEPAGWQFKSINGDWLGLIGEDGKNQAIKEGCEVRPLYASAPAAVLPPEITPAEAMRFGNPHCGNGYQLLADVYNQALADVKALGRQPAAVLLPEIG
ncbi:hypothetical protein [Erwinia sp. SLM-02]|uniref:hypothetical protein n=1 Tax=Erwinia sp. SLM-02 TaxID=3020057 RepID=UPI003080EBC1